jgi:hypothetical protein
LGGFNLNDLVEFDYNFPTVNKIFLSADDRNVENLWAGTLGVAPNRTYVVRSEGWDGAYGSIYEENNNFVWEAVFYENEPSRIDIRFVENASFRSEFTLEELESYGVVLDGPVIPVRVQDVDVDISDAVSDGIIFVGAAGNSGIKIDTVNGVDYDNYLVENGEHVYYHRGSSPANSHPSLICVGALSSISDETKTALSNTGPGVDIYAPGENIIAAVFDNSGAAGDLLDEGNGELYQKWTGSSIAAAQVTGILALALEKYPRMTQSEAKEYITRYARQGLMTDSAGSYADSTSLQEGPNEIAYYYKERRDDGVLVPKSVEWLRPSQGQVYPRPQINFKR